MNVRSHSRKEKKREKNDTVPSWHLPRFSEARRRDESFIEESNGRTFIVRIFCVSQGCKGRYGVHNVTLPPRQFTSVKTFARVFVTPVAFPCLLRPLTLEIDEITSRSVFRTTGTIGLQSYYTFFVLRTRGKKSQSDFAIDFIVRPPAPHQHPSEIAS